MDISVLVPTRNRPIQLKKLIISVYETAFDPDNIEMCFYINEDEKTVSVEVIESLGYKNIKFKCGERVIMGDLWNKAMELATADILMLGNDDFIFRSRDWDRYILEVFEKYEDKILYVYGKNGNPQQKSGTYGFLHRNWVNTVGYFTPPYFVSDGVDGWLNEVSLSLGRRVFVPEVFIEHMHFTLGKSAMDSTYAERIADGVREREAGKRPYEEKAPERLDNIRRLQEFIDNYGE